VADRDNNRLFTDFVSSDAFWQNVLWHPGVHESQTSPLGNTVIDCLKIMVARVREIPILMMHLSPAIAAFHAYWRHDGAIS
jgi:hypothetical protein